MSEHNIADTLIDWYHIHKRDLPWRNTNNPYHIWVSEIILQQTRVAQGLKYYIKFIDELPTISDFAEAHQDKILRLWQGLGYYSRARNMHATAKQIVDEYKGEFPNNYEELQKLKGVGSYTAAAIASFSFNEIVPVVDGNVFRVLSRLFAMDDDISDSKSKKVFFNLASQIISQSKPADFNQAIMEFGALHCIPKNPDCSSCPLNRNCISFQNNKVADYPVKTKKVKTRKRYFNYLIIKSDNSYLLKQRTEKDIWNGLYDFPLIESKAKNLTTEALIDAFSSLFPMDKNHLVVTKSSKIVKHVLSHQHIYAQFFHLEITDNQALKKLNLKAYSKTEIQALAKPILVDNYLQQHIF